MKNMITIIAFATLFSCKAQVIYPLGSNDFSTNNYYIKDVDNHHDAIVGIWKWGNVDNYFEITLQEFEMFVYPEGSTMSRDHIFGKYKYVVDGEVISEVLTIEPIPNSSISLYFDTPTLYNIVIKDDISEKTKKGTFTLTSPTSAVIEFHDLKGIIFGGNGNGQEWTLPTSLVLIKQ